MARIYKKGKTSLVSSILNILGLTAAFAALYIISCRCVTTSPTTRPSKTATASIA